MEDVNYMRDDRGRINQLKYGKPPTIAEIDRVKKILRAPDRIIEIVFTMPTDTIKRVRYNGRQIPSKYWHYFYITLIGFKREGKTDKDLISFKPYWV